MFRLSFNKVALTDNRIDKTNSINVTLKIDSSNKNGQSVQNTIAKPQHAARNHHVKVNSSVNNNWNNNGNNNNHNESKEKIDDISLCRTIDALEDDLTTAGTIFGGLLDVNPGDTAGAAFRSAGGSIYTFFGAPTCFHVGISRLYTTYKCNERQRN